MIVSAYLENFQSHQKTSLELAPDGHLTVITGASDTGKSAIIRGLRWLFNNTPQGADFIRAGASSAAVAVTLEAGVTIVRERGKSFNRYRILRPGQPDQVLEGFGSDVPLEVRELTGVSPVTVGDLALNLNLSEQLDGPFLGKSVSGGARAKILGKLAGTEEIDLAGKELSTDLYRAVQEEKSLGADIDVLAAQIKTYSWLPDFEERIRGLETILTSAIRSRERGRALVGLRDRLAAIAPREAEAKAVVERWSGLGQAGEAHDAAFRGGAKGAILRNCRERLADVTAAEAAVKATLTRWAGVETAASAHEVATLAHTRGMTLSNFSIGLAQIRSAETLNTQTLTRWLGISQAAGVAVVVDGAILQARHLSDLVRNLAEVTNAETFAKGQLTRWSGLEKGARLVADVETISSRVSALAALSRSLKGLEDARAVAEAAARQWAGAASAQTLLAAVESSAVREAALKALSSKLGDLRREQILAETRRSDMAKVVSDSESQYLDALVIAGTCPTCGSAVDPDRLHVQLRKAV